MYLIQSRFLLKAKILPIAKLKTGLEKGKYIRVMEHICDVDYQHILFENVFYYDELYRL